jgi:hypothetical protein
VQGELGTATFDFDMTIDAVSVVTTVFFVNLYDGANNRLCGFGLNVGGQSAAMLVASVITDAGPTYATKNRVDTFPATGFGHVTLRWTSSPPEISAVVAGHDLGALAAPDCVASQRADVAFGLQTPLSPIVTRMRADNVVYSFAP